MFYWPLVLGPLLALGLRAIHPTHAKLKMPILLLTDEKLAAQQKQFADNGDNAGVHACVGHDTGRSDAPELLIALDEADEQNQVTLCGDWAWRFKGRAILFVVFFGLLGIAQLIIWLPRAGDTFPEGTSQSIGRFRAAHFAWDQCLLSWSVGWAVLMLDRMMRMMDAMARHLDVLCCIRTSQHLYMSVMHSQHLVQANCFYFLHYGVGWIALITLHGGMGAFGHPENLFKTVIFVAKALLLLFAITTMAQANKHTIALQDRLINLSKLTPSGFASAPLSPCAARRGAPDVGHEDACSPHRIVGFAQFIARHPVQCELFGVAINSQLMIGYAVTVVAAAVGSASDIFVTAAQSKWF